MDQNGLVRGVSGGEATIFARADADESIQASRLITVRQMPDSIQIRGSTEIYIGNHSRLTAEVTPANTYDSSVTWTSSDPNIATVSEDGLVTALSRGSVTITAKSNADESVAEMVVVMTEPEWTEWTAWTTTEAAATADMQVEDRIEYSYQDTTYTAWSRWSEYSTTPISVPSGDNDIMRVDTAPVYGWYYFLCPHCQNHNRYWGTNKCSNCGQTIPSGNTWHAYNTNQSWNAEGQSYTETYYGYGLLWSWSDGNGLKGATGYRQQTRSRIVGSWSAWSPEAVTEFSTEDRVRKVNTRKTWRRRYHSTFDEKVISDWVPENEAPVNVVVVNSKWKYTEHTSSASETLEGWTQAPDGGWKQTASGSVRSANFSAYPTFDTGSALYRAYNVTPPTAYETAAAKRTVSSAEDGYIYWHYMYSVSANAYDRVIYYTTGYGNGPVSRKYYYRYFQAHESTAAYNKTQANDGQDASLYSWYVNTSDHQSNAESGGSWYWYRIPITKTTYTDYVKNYEYIRERETTEAPQTGGNITGAVRYVQYFLAGEE